MRSQFILKYFKCSRILCVMCFLRELYVYLYLIFIFIYITKQTNFLVEVIHVISIFV